MEVKINLNRRSIFDGIVVLELVLLVIFGFQIASLSKKLSKGGAGPVAVAPTPSAPDAPAAGKVKPIDDSDYVRGDKKAPLSLIEYSDFECPFCKRFHPTVVKILEDYKGKVKWVYRHYPLSFHANAQKQAEAAECVGSLGGADKYWKFIDELFEKTASGGTGFALDALPGLAAGVGVNKAKFEECLNSGKFAQKVQQDLNEGTEAGVSGTPGTLLVVDKTGSATLIEGAQSYEYIKRAVDAALASL